MAGLMAIFGSRKEEETMADVPFALPQSVAMEAGLAQDRSFVGINYGQDGLARPNAPTARNVSAPASTVQINVQAMDSRSFLDHSDEIARAVREAMLHSHSLNDVVSEL